MSTSSPTTTSRSLFFRFRVAAALLAVLVAVDVGLLFQNSWSKQDNAAIETRELRECARRSMRSICAARR